MDIEKVKKMAIELRDKHGLFDWNIKFKSHMYRGDSTIATTYFNEREFHFSTQNFLVNNKKFCRDQILHEIAHALVGWEEAHGNIWRKKCVEIGAVPFLVYEKEYPLVAINAFPQAY